MVNDTLRIRHHPAERGLITVDPPGHGHGHYIHAWYPSVRPKSKNTLKSKPGKQNTFYDEHHG